MSHREFEEALSAELGARHRLAMDAGQKRDEKGQFSAEQHSAAAEHHEVRANEHRDLSKGREGTHNTARRDHMTAAGLHKHAAAGKPGMAKYAHEATGAANKSSETAHRDEPGGTPARVVPQIR